MTQIAQTICNQMGGINRLKLMVNGRHFLSDGNIFSFKYTGKNKNKSNYLAVKMNNNDCYDLEFGRLYGDTYTVIEKLENIYSDQLVGIFEEKTGLYLTL